MKRKLPNLDKRHTKHRPVSPEEAKLWREEMGEEALLPPSEKESAGVWARSEAVVKSEDQPKAPCLNPPPFKGRKTIISLQSFDSRALLKLRRGVVEPEAVLDLHGYSQASAHAALLHFVEKCRTDGVRLVLIITGKGRGGGGTLRALLPRWIEETPLRGRIIAYDVAGPRHGGEGAWYVRIRK